MGLSAALRDAKRRRIREERLARGQCVYCGDEGHFRRYRPRRAAVEAYRMRMAAATVIPACPPVV